MSTSEETLKEKSVQGTPENPQSSQRTGAASTAEIPDLTEQIKKLIEKLDAPKKKSVWDVFPVLTTFMGTVVLAGISLYVTQSAQRQAHDHQVAESARVAQFNQAQIETQRAQTRVEELKALTTLAPLLTSRDPAARATARQLLQAVGASAPVNPAASNPGSGNSTANPGTGSSGAATIGTADRGNLNPVTPNFAFRLPSQSSGSLFDKFAAIALSEDASAQDRVAATRKIGEIATERRASKAVRDRAADIAARLATSPEAPPEVKQAAVDVIAKIKRATPNEVVQMINSQPLTRKVTEVILHDAGIPASFYKGPQSIYGIARAQASRPGFNGRVGWHYAIAADGAIWLGEPLNDIAIHAGRQSRTSASVMLLMDGNKETPTDAQRASFVVVLNALMGRLKLEGAADSPDGSGFHFHRDYDRNRTCPGTLLTKEMVLGWR
jgi:hypothetical protein